jgi:hypothetical protein
LFKVVEIMSVKRKSLRVAIDLPKLERVSVKVVHLLGRKIRNPIDAYLVLKWLCFSFEADFGIQLEPEEENKLRRLAALKPKDNEG